MTVILAAATCIPASPMNCGAMEKKNYRIMKKYYDIRISMHDYIKQLYDEASENGSPLIRTMFYEFPDDKKCWELQDQYMFGSEYLVAPIFHLNEFEREAYIFRQDAGKTPETEKCTKADRLSVPLHRSIRFRYLRKWHKIV